MNSRWLKIGCVAMSLAVASTASAQLGKRTASEKKVVTDPVSGVQLTFLTSAPSGDNTLYQTHQGWTSDGKWIVFRSGDRAGEGQGAQAFAVNEETGVIVQITEGPGNGFGSGALNVAQKSMKVYYTKGGGARGGGATPGLYELDLAKLLADSEAGTVKDRSTYERLCGAFPEGMRVGGGFGLDANEQIAYLGVTGGDVGQRLPAGTAIAEPFGPRGMGRGPSGIRAMDLKTGQISFVADVHFQIGHMQANPFNPGEIIFCWETGGKAPTRAWVINADGTDLRPVYNERENDWITHETVIGKDEVALAMMGHRRIGSAPGVDWGVAGTREFPTGVAVVNLRTRALELLGQPSEGSGLWHVNGSYDGRFLTGDDFARNIWLIDRRNREMIKLSTGHKQNAADHPHPIFNPAGTKILVQSSMIYSGEATNRLPHDLCLIPVPSTWLNRTFSDKTPE